MHELNELIAAGWGHIPQSKIPKDWRKRKPPANWESRTELLARQTAKNGKPDISDGIR